MTSVHEPTEEIFLHGWQAGLHDAIGWIERNHLGKGLDGTDRWEHAAAEIIAWLQSQLNRRQPAAHRAGERTKENAHTAWIDKADDQYVACWCPIGADHDYAQPPAAGEVAAIPQEVIDSPEFQAIWRAIKNWDLERQRGELYAGANGTDVMTILNAVKPAYDARFEAALDATDVSRTWSGEVARKAWYSHDGGRDNA